MPYLWVVPGLTKPGTVCERPVDLMSVYPTLCDLAGVPIPDHVRGARLRPLLADPAAPWQIPAVTTYHQNNHSIRSETWRYIHYANGDEELYNHDQDPYEWKNLALDPSLGLVKAELAQAFPRENVAELPRTGGDSEGEGGKPIRKGRKQKPAEN